MTSSRQPYPSNRAPANTYAASPAASAQPASTPVQRTTATEWTTRPEAEFINSLCPVGRPVFPTFPWMREDQRRHIAAAFVKGFYRGVGDYAESRRMVVLGALDTQYERMVFLAIERKTLAYGKLLEKIPISKFVNGERDLQTGELSLDAFGNPRFPPAVPDDSAFSKGRRTLIDRGLITMVASAERPQLAARRWRQERSNVYAALPLGDALTRLFTAARAAALEAGDLTENEIVLQFQLLWRETMERCRDVLAEAEGAPERAAAAREVTKARMDAAKARKLSANTLAPTTPSPILAPATSQPTVSTTVIQPATSILPATTSATRCNDNADDAPAAVSAPADNAASGPRIRQRTRS